MNYNAVRQTVVQACGDHKKEAEKTIKIGLGVWIVSGIGELLFEGLPFEIGIVAGLATAGLGYSAKAVAESDERKRTLDGERICSHNRRLSDCSKCHPNPGRP